MNVNSGINEYMTSVNYIGILQHICQVNNFGLPVYTSKLKDDSQKHKPLWYSEVECDFGKKGMIGTGKIQSRQLAAYVLLKDLCIKKEDIEVDSFGRFTSPEPVGDIVLFRPSKNTQPQRVLLVDHENLPNFVYTMNEKHINFVEKTFVFVYEQNPLIDKKLPSHCILQPTGTSRENGSDCAMILFVGDLLSNHRYDEYIIATKDKFGDVLVDQIRYDKFPWRRADARRVRKVEQLIC